MQSEKSSLVSALDLAVSNLFGSNIFNIAILGICDLVYPGNLWANISGVHIFTAVVAMVMTSVAVVGLIYRAARPTRIYITWDGLALISLYMGGMYVIYRS
ncbi:Sodium/calcium exchanger protein [Synechocystis sp. PCC 7509]|uniref:Sodium/calcium exchanger protein n=1 Tax=Synechocystis sp. PCC 7509 TaxID=927677 RepID=UPI0002ABED4D|nr:Sodium/calcium exchanger protein [Synechocystis sp. PCC 7509]